MTKQELAALPRGTQLFCISRKISRSGMREVFDVFYIVHSRSWDSERIPVDKTEYSLRWIRIAPEDKADFVKHSECHPTTSIDEDNRTGGTFYVNGCGFDRVAAVIESLSRWATNDPRYFVKERI